MINRTAIQQWSEYAPWIDNAQIEQDLIICRALVSIFSDEFLASQLAFSTPTNNPNDYIPSQIIAEHLRQQGYDGIRYGSSLHKGGYNLTVFNVTKCEAIFSTDLRLEEVKMSLRPAIGAENIDGRFEYIKDNVPMRMDWDSGKLIEAKV